MLGDLDPIRRNPRVDLAWGGRRLYCRLLAIPPTFIGLKLCGLVADPEQVARQMEALADSLPEPPQCRPAGGCWFLLLYSADDGAQS